MAKVLLIAIYNILVVPILLLAFHLLAIFSKKSRSGLLGRYQTAKQAKDFIRQFEGNPPKIFLFHCASMGEFEHIKPLLRGLKARHPASKNVVMFFSPSGYDNVKQMDTVDLFLYAPFDSWFSVRGLFKTLKPIALFIAKYDLWPNQAWVAAALNIPAYLVNATLYDASGRLNPLIRWFQSAIYQELKHIFAISETDKQQYQKLAQEEMISVSGDTKYDQVIFRCEESRQKTLVAEKIYKGKKILVAGSAWPADEKRLIPAIKNLYEKYPDLLTIVCPHEPHDSHLQQLEKSLHPLKSRRYSRLAMYHDEAVIIIDRIGLLANLYSLGDVAYVGGSFKQNIHNVLEPAVYGIPVLFGPVNQNSHEAQLLKKCGGGIEITNETDLFAELNKLLTVTAYRETTGKNAWKLVEQYRGATKKVLDAL